MSAAKRSKSNSGAAVAPAAGGAAEEEEFFPSISRIAFNPAAPPTETLVFRHYNAEEVVLGRPMHAWLRFAVCFWHTFRGQGLDPFGAPTIKRPWDDESQSMANAKRRLRAAFEFMQKLGVRFWTFHDRDIAPVGRDLAETNRNLDEVADLALQLQHETGIRLLWATANLFSHPRYKDGAATSPSAEVFVHAAAQVKKAMEVAHRLGADNFVFWGGREGFGSYLNTDIHRELSHMARFPQMAVAHKQNLGQLDAASDRAQAQCVPPSISMYADAWTTMAFLKQFELDKDFKLSDQNSTSGVSDWQREWGRFRRHDFLAFLYSHTV